MNKIVYEFYVGLNLKDSSSAITIEKAKKDLEEFFKEYKTDFSINSQKGGYVHENGNYGVEDGVKITIIGDYADTVINEFIEGIKKIYNQESVLLITKVISAELK